MTAGLPGYVDVAEADVYKNGRLAAHLTRTPQGVTFRYIPEYVASGGFPVATTLPLTASAPPPLPGGALPPYFTGLLPEGRRFSMLHRAVKTSKDDELSLLLAVGTDLVGDVLVVPSGAPSPFLFDPSGHAVTTISGTLVSPERLDFDEVRAEHGIIDRAGLAGVQDKVSMRTIALPITMGGDRPYFLKLNPPQYPRLVQIEAATMAVARRLKGCEIATTRVVYDEHGQSGLFVERFDRVGGRPGEFRHLPVEDGTQVLGLPPAEKYRVTLESLIVGLAALCAARPVALRTLFVQCVWAWLSGNGDLHAKNLSLLGDGFGEWRVSPGYDIPMTLPYGDTSMALSVGGRRDGLSRRHFLALAAEIGLPERAAQRSLAEAVAVSGDLLAQVESGVFPLPPGVRPKKVAAQLRARRRHF